MSLLTIVRRACILTGQPVPPAILTTQDKTALAMAELSQIEAEERAARHDWPNIVKEHSFTTIAAVTQTGALPSDFDRFTASNSDRGQLYAVARREGLAGPASDAQWRELTSGFAGWTTSWRISGGALQMAPAPAAGLVHTFSYVSNKLYRSAAQPPVDAAAWVSDSDTCLIPESLIALGVVWRWKQSKGFDYAEDLATAEAAVEREAGKIGGGRRMLVIGPSRLPLDSVYPYPWALGH